MIEKSPLCPERIRKITGSLLSSSIASYAMASEQSQPA